MKAQYLKQLLNNTGYTVGNYDDYIAVGSPLCHDLVKVMKKDYSMIYALSIKPKVRHREDVSGELRTIWDRLIELIASGELAEIIAGQDVIEKPIMVYAVVRGKFISTTCAEYGWPNTTIDGIIMHDNVYFPTAAEALEHGIQEQKAWIKYVQDNIDNKRREIKEAEDMLMELTNNLDTLQNY